MNATQAVSVVIFIRCFTFCFYFVVTICDLVHAFETITA